MAELEFKQLWRNHPLNYKDPEQFPCRRPKAADGKQKGSPSFANQCAIRMGVCLRRSGVTIDQLSGVGNCWYHPKEDMHILVAEKLARRLASANIPGLGNTEKITGKDVSDYYAKLFGRTGVIFFKDYWSRGTASGKESAPSGDHIDVWNGYRSSAGWLMQWFSWLGYYGPYVKAGQIWFWEVK